ncbi:aquaporin-like protein [Podospora appendiculata]|uniref:Aquaporin-like protein n=1 Tax=Podospora appendiculata TaxID=314037 RepID=A0AAE1CIW0_9PEZI|nr:aquaporin-like protein [Podospora appendiculata]
MRPPASTFRLASFASGRTGTGTNNGADTPIPSIFGRKELPHTMRTHIVAFLGEFVGTFMFLFFAFAGTQVANTPPAPTDDTGAVAPPNAANLIFIALAFGTSLMANVWAFYRVTGGLFNPSVTLALFLVGGIPALRSVLFLVAQLLGGIAAAGVVSALFPGPMAVNTTLGGGASVAQGLFIEMFLTAELVFVIIMVAAEKHKSTFLAPVAIGLAFFLAELVGVYFTGGSLNFARSLGPAVVNGTFPGYFWIYFVGPMLGSLLASGFYSLLNYLRWKDCNPGQDFNDVEKLRSLSQKHVNGDDTKNGVRETNGGVVEQDEHVDH